MAARWLLLLLAVTIANAASKTGPGPSNYLNNEDKSRLLSILKSAQGKLKSAAEAHFVFASLRHLGEQVPKDKGCSKIENLVSDSEIKDLYSASKFGCKPKLTKARASTVQNALDSSSISEIFMGSSIIESLGAKEKFSFDKLKGTLASLKVDDGSFKATPHASRPDAASTAFAILIGSAVGLPKDSKSASAMIQFGKSNKEGLYFTSPGPNRIATTSIVLECALGNGISQDDISRIASFIIDSKHVREVDDIFYLLSALQLSSENPIAVPLVLSVKGTTAVVSDVMGNKVDADITLTKAVNQVSKEENKIGSKLAGGKIPGSLKGGVYEMHFEVKAPSKKFHSFSASKLVRIPVDLEPKSFALYLGKGSKLSGKEDKHVAKFPGKLKAKLVANEAEYMLFAKLALTGGSTADQVFLQFIHKESGKSAIFVMTQGKNSYNFKMNLGSSDFTDNTYGLGTYVLSAIVGGGDLQKSQTWTIGEIEVTWPPAQSKDSAMDDLAPMKEISHVFQAPPKTPNFIISLVFTIACLAPLGILHVGVQKLGLRLQLPAGSQKLWAIAFQGSLFAIVILNVMYFLYLNIFEALGGLCILSIPTTLTGIRALNYLNTARQKKKDD